MPLRSYNINLHIKSFSSGKHFNFISGFCTVLYLLKNNSKKLDLPQFLMKLITRLARLSGAAFVLHSGANLAFLRDEILDLD